VRRGTDRPSWISNSLRRAGGRVGFEGLRCHQRNGISLFEVVLALSIFLGAIAAISEVLRTGSRAAVRAQLQSQAAILCDRQMNRILAGVEPMEATSKAILDGQRDWLWSLNILDSGVPSLLRLELTVERTGQGPDAAVTTQLVRLVRDPQFFVDAAAAAAEASATQSSTGGL